MADQREHFQGDMSRNEVEIDLSKFMAMVTEIGELKTKIMKMQEANGKRKIETFLIFTFLV